MALKDSTTAGSSNLVLSDWPGSFHGVPYKPHGDSKSGVLGPICGLLTIIGSTT